MPFLYIDSTMSIHMNISDATKEFLQTLDKFSRGKLTRREDVGTLLEIAEIHGMRDQLTRLSFMAKFVSRVYGIMKRVGKDGEGYDKLAGEFRTNLEEAGVLTRLLVEKAPDAERKHFEASYFALTQDGLQNFLALLHDLAWYKNWQIDHGNDAP